MGVYLRESVYHYPTVTSPAMLGFRMGMRVNLDTLGQCHGITQHESSFGVQIHTPVHKNIVSEFQILTEVETDVFFCYKIVATPFK